MESDAIATIVKDIIDLKYEAGNIEGNDTLEDMLDHYNAMLLMGNIEILYRYGKLMGFADWIRLPRIPDNNRFTYMDMDTEHGGPVLYVMNCCVRDDKKHKVLWNLYHRLMVKNYDCEILCWHEKDGTLKRYPNTKRKKAEVTL